MSTIKSFAKIFETNDFGQILVFRDENDKDQPCIKTMFYVPKFDAMATLTSSYPDTEEGVETADRIFSGLSIEKLREIVLSAPVHEDFNEEIGSK